MYRVGVSPVNARNSWPALPSPAGHTARPRASAGTTPAPRLEVHADGRRRRRPLQGPGLAGLGARRAGRARRHTAVDCSRRRRVDTRSRGGRQRSRRRGRRRAAHQRAGRHSGRRSASAPAPTSRRPSTPTAAWSGHRRHRAAPRTVGSTRSAVPVLPPVRFCGPPSEPGVPVSVHRALHECRYAVSVWIGQGVGMFAPRNR
jgi:hypothetical protein